MSDKQIATCFHCFDHHIIGASHVSNKRCDTTCHCQHNRPLFGAIFGASIATTPIARWCTKLIDYSQIDWQIDRRTRRRTKICALRQAIGRITQCKHHAEQQRTSEAMEVSQVRLRAAVSAIATPLWCEFAKHDFQSHQARRQFLTTSNFRRNTTPTQCAPAQVIF